MEKILEDKKGLINKLIEIQELKNDSEANLVLMNKLDRNSNLYEEDYHAFQREIYNKKKLIDKKEKDLIKILGEGRFIFQNNPIGNARPVRAEIKIEGGVVNYVFYSI